MQRALSGMPARRRELEREENDGVGVGIRDEGRKERKEGRKKLAPVYTQLSASFYPNPLKHRDSRPVREEREMPLLPLSGNILFLNEITGEGKEPRCKENRVCGRKRRRRGVKESRERYNTCPLADEGSLFGTSEKRIGREERCRFRTAERDGYRL